MHFPENGKRIQAHGLGLARMHVEMVSKFTRGFQASGFVPTAFSSELQLHPVGLEPPIGLRLPTGLNHEAEDIDQHFCWQLEIV